MDRVSRTPSFHRSFRDHVRDEVRSLVRHGGVHFATRDPQVPRLGRDRRPVLGRRIGGAGSGGGGLRPLEEAWRAKSVVLNLTEPDVDLAEAFASNEPLVHTVCVDEHRTFWLGSQLKLSASWVCRSVSERTLIGVVVSLDGDMPHVAVLVDGFLPVRVVPIPITSRMIFDLVGKSLLERKRVDPKAGFIRPDTITLGDAATPCEQLGACVYGLFGYTCPDMRKEMSKHHADPDTWTKKFDVTCHDGSSVTVEAAEERFIGAEAWFRPELVLGPTAPDGDPVPGLAEVVLKAVEIGVDDSGFEMDPELRARVLENIVLAGDAVCKDLARRLERDVGRLLRAELTAKAVLSPSKKEPNFDRCKCKVVTHHLQKTAAWFGLSMLASSSALDTVCTLRDCMKCLSEPTDPTFAATCRKLGPRGKLVTPVLPRLPYGGGHVPSADDDKQAIVAGAAAAAEALFGKRIMAADLTPVHLPPILGVMESPDVSLDIAVQPLVDLFGSDDIAVAAFMAGAFADDLSHRHGADPHGLSREEAAALNLYTQEILYRSLNTALRSMERIAVKPFFPVLKLLLQALGKIPAYTGSLFRGVKESLCSEFTVSRKFVWWAFSSCTTTGEVLDNPMFLGTSGPRTLFSIETTSGRDIRRYSAYAAEDEILLLPGVQFEVRSQMAVPGARGLELITVKECVVPFKLIK
eukprot:m.17889 g.17889  ORF g.17889 m.17889 type:complete len:692 (+) comp9448_c1_seq1:338-2413(+)